MTLFQRLHRNFRSSRRRQRRNRSGGQEVATPLASPSKPTLGRDPGSALPPAGTKAVPLAPSPAVSIDNPKTEFRETLLESRLESLETPLETPLESPPLDLVSLCTSPTKSPVRVNSACDALPRIDYADTFEYSLPTFHHPEPRGGRVLHSPSPTPRLDSHITPHHGDDHADHYSDSGSSSWYGPHEIASSTSVSSNLTDLTHVDDGLTDWGLPKVLVPSFEDSPVVDVVPVLSQDQQSEDEFFDAATEVSEPLFEPRSLPLAPVEPLSTVEPETRFTAAQAKTIASTLTVVYTALVLKRAGVVPKRYASQCRSQIRAQMEARQAQAIADSIIPIWM